jgi:hypothetical protein
MKLTDLELDYLRLKMKMNGYDFISNDEFTDSLDDKDPEEIDIYDLYVADIIPEPLYLALIDNGYYKVSDLNYAAIDTISPITMSHIAILKTVIKKYNLHYVETTDELRQVIANSDGHDVDILVLFKYLHLDAESQAAVRELWLKFTNNVRGKAEELTYISDLTLSISEYDAIINDKEYAPIAGLKSSPADATAAVISPSMSAACLCNKPFVSSSILPEAYLKASPACSGTDEAMANANA